MSYRKINTDTARRERFGYGEGRLPIPRICNKLNEFSQGTVDCHWHPEIQFGFILHGEINYKLFKDEDSAIETTLHAGDGFFINSKVLHSYQQCAPGAEIFVFSIAPGFFSSTLIFGSTYQKIILPVLHSSVSGLFFRKENKLHDSLLKSFADFYALNPDSIDYELQGLKIICDIWCRLYDQLRLQKILPSFTRISSVHEQRLRMMLEFIHKHYTEPISVDMIAQSAKISKRECFRCFHESISQSPSEYLNQYRLSIAAYLLANTTHTIAYICNQCGFNNVSYFGKQFRKNYGISPGQYRTSARLY